MKRASQRINDSFDASDREDIYRFLDWVRSAISERSQQLRRTVTIAILLIAVFEVVIQSPRTEVALGSFRLYRGSFVLQFVPVLIAYLYYQLVIDSCHLNEMQDISAAAFSKWSSKGYENGLHPLIQSPMPSYWNITGAQPDLTLSKIETTAEYIFVILILLGVPAFEAQAYYALYDSSTVHVLWIASVIVSTIFCVMAIWHFIVYNMN